MLFLQFLLKKRGKSTKISVGEEFGAKKNRTGSCMRFLCMVLVELDRSYIGVGQELDRSYTGVG